MLTIDGSTGEGGGQILRTALSLAALLRRPVALTNIRAGRQQPGLRPQHVQAVNAVAAICNARVEGAAEHSRELLFEPQTAPQAGKYRFAIGTAGAATLVLQAVLPPLSRAAGPSQVVVTGGTHVAWSPPVDYVQQVYLPALAPLGYAAEVDLVRWGSYPRGGGEIALRVHGVSQDPLEGVAATSPPWAQPRGELLAVQVTSAAAHVGQQVAALQARQVYNRLAAAGIAPHLIETRLFHPPSPGPGTCLFLLARYSGGVCAGFTGYGRQGYPAERVADDAVDGFLRHHASGAPVDPHLADQLILPLALAGVTTDFATSEITRHLLTNAWVVAQFLGPCVAVQGSLGEPGRVAFTG